MKSIGVIKESETHETRVALVPETVAALIKAHKTRVILSPGAGLKAGYSDEEYLAAGAEIGKDQAQTLEADIIVAVNAFYLAQENLSNKLVIGLFDPFMRKSELKALKEKKASVLALELIPRISRAQSMDVLSSQANIAGYMAVLHATSRLNKVIPMLMTAAGTIKAAQILVLGAGVAGLQAIATAKRLGAVVHGYDVRPVVKEQVESLGARFVSINMQASAEGAGGYAKALSEDVAITQRALLSDFAKNMDVIITTAQIPGAKAPRLLDDIIFESMKEGSVIVDLAAASGGNVSNSVPHEWKKVSRVWLYGAHNLACMLPKDASFCFSRNIKALLELVLGQESLQRDDEIIREALICEDGLWLLDKFKEL